MGSWDGKLRCFPPIGAERWVCSVVLRSSGRREPKQTSLGLKGIYGNREQIAEQLVLVSDQLPANTVPQVGPISSIMGQILLVAPDGAG